MPAPLTYASAFAYLLGLGERFASIGRSALTFTGEAPAGQAYPVLLVEGDGQASELLRGGVEPTGQDSFTVAVQVLAKTEANSPTTDELAALLRLTNTWADQLTEQLRTERPTQLAGVNKLALPGQAGADLATGWRVELTLKLRKDVDRDTIASLFTPEQV